MVTSHLDVTAERHPQRIILRLRGELDVSNHDDLRAVIYQLLETGPLPVVVDLSGLTFADCGGMAVLIAVRNRLAVHGFDLRVTAPQPIVRRLLTVTGMDTLLHLDEDEHHAP
ncbi:MAG: STAS domain-containing protein [Streptosporangiaceae bacterium]